MWEAPQNVVVLLLLVYALLESTSHIHSNNEWIWARPGKFTILIRHSYGRLNMFLGGRFQQCHNELHASVTSYGLYSTTIRSTSRACRELIIEWSYITSVRLLRSKRTRCFKRSVRTSQSNIRARRNRESTFFSERAGRNNNKVLTAMFIIKVIANFDLGHKTIKIYLT